MPSEINTYADSDYAGCIKTRQKYKCGGAITFGHHCIKTWSTTQAVIALSSGEAEYYSLVKAASQSIGIQNMLFDVGIKTDINVHTDSSTTCVHTDTMHLEYLCQALLQTCLNAP